MNTENRRSANKNRLAGESSPYLLQHAENPVDWYPWGQEAFEKAHREDRPVFLSIGYSTCHWCHVMAHESFEDEAVAEIMNRSLVSIKVDREERPDIDSAYMLVCQMMTGTGGWPLSLFLTPEGKPFYAATYIPKTSRAGRAGMMELVPTIEKIWREQKTEIDKVTDRISAALAESGGAGPGELDESVFDKTFRILAHQYDEQHGGFGNAPKFPNSSFILFLLRYWKERGNARALEMAEKTLREMRGGGMFDQVGYGFHRYATDRGWHVPHFEKMLYDQALLSLAYTEAHQATGRDEFRRTVFQILTYVEGRLLAPEGVFFSAEDADSEGEEGKFYTWTYDDLKAVLTGEDLEFCRTLWGVGRQGNYLDEATGRMTGSNILHLRVDQDSYAGERRMTEEAFLKRVESIRVRLHAAREKRVRPHRDDKVLTDWNGLMIAAFARAGRVFGETSFTSVAVKSVEFVLEKMVDGDGRILHRYREGEAGIPGFLSDYTHLIFGLIEVYQSTFETRYLERAAGLQKKMEELFGDGGGGYFSSARDTEKVLIRQRELYDGSVPSGNGMALHNLLRLGHLTGDRKLFEDAEELVRVFAQQVERYPAGSTFFLLGYGLAAWPVREVVIAGRRGEKDTEEMLGIFSTRYLPDTVVLFNAEGGGGTMEKGGRGGEQGSGTPGVSDLSALAPFAAVQRTMRGRATCYICSDFSCDLPLNDPKEVLSRIEGGG